MKQRLTGSIIILIFLALLTAGVILYARGFQLDFKKGLKTTGLLAATSSPAGASIFIDDRLTSATNDTISLEPGWYQIRLTKEGYLPWKKKMEIKKEIVSETNAVLFPSNPSLSPLISTGAKSPSLSPDGTKLAYIIPYSRDTQQATRNTQETDYGVFIFALNGHPLSFSKNPSQLFSYKINPDEKVDLIWSPDASQLLLLNQNSAFLLDLSKKDQPALNVIGTLTDLLASWQREKEEMERKKLMALPEALVEFFSQSTKIIDWSADDSKILYQATASAEISEIIKPPLLATNPTKETRQVEAEKIYVYDRKEDKNYLITKQPNNQTTEENEFSVNQLLSVAPKALQWLPTSRHLILTEQNQISILEYDGINKATIYAGPFAESFAAAWPDGSKLIILTTLNPAASTLPNLYSLSLK